MLTGIKDETNEEIKTETKVEDEAEDTYTGVKKSKKVEISTLLNQFERKMKRIGELKVEVVNLERQLAEQGSSLEDDKKIPGANRQVSAWCCCPVLLDLRASAAQDARRTSKELRQEGSRLGEENCCPCLDGNRSSNSSTGL